MGPRKTIDANGNVVVVGDTTISSGSIDSAQPQPSLMASLQSMQTVNAFGFQLPARQFWIGMAVVAFVVGIRGGTLILAVWCFL